MDNNYQLVELSFKNSITNDFEIPPHERHLEGEIGAGSILSDKISIKVGNNPLVYNLKKLYELSGKIVPPEIQIFTSYDVWIVNFNIGILKSGGLDNVRQIGFKVKYREPDFVNVIEIMPKTEFIKLFEGKLSFDADLGLNGQVNPPNIELPFLGQQKVIGVGGKLNFSTDTSIVGRLNFSVVSSLIMSVGIGSNTAEWIMNKGNNPLYGDDITFTNIIMVESGTEKIELEAMIYSTISVYNLIPSRRTSKWMNISCDLKN
ncbi:MAG: hypothetical protein WCH34_02970 [Bacteroidota bacterium]